MSSTSTRRAVPSSGSLSRAALPLPSSSSSSSSCRHRHPHHHLVTTLSTSSPRPTPPSQPHIIGFGFCTDKVRLDPGQPPEMGAFGFHIGTR
ncbi:hypothetical protein Tco_1330850, partial [Tanacetum coccineum]